MDCKDPILEQGSIIIYTGDGKGKSSAALGMALRATGHKMYVSVVQFIKAPSATGENRAAERLAPELEILSAGRGFVTGTSSAIPLSERRHAAHEALKLARQRMFSGAWDMVILDEINDAVHTGLLDPAEVLDLIKRKPLKLHVVLTGRNAHPDLIDIADSVTEMRAVKHRDDQGMPARRGVDF